MIAVSERINFFSIGETEPHPMSTGTREYVRALHFADAPGQSQSRQDDFDVIPDAREIGR